LLFHWVKIGTLRGWIRKYSTLTKTENEMENQYLEKIKRLEKELGQVKQERDLLKKAAAYFAQESR
jgi:transposase